MPRGIWQRLYLGKRFAEVVMVFREGEIEAEVEIEIL